ncbi:hypothetical protein [Paenibacillus tyrfis]|uniref:hypothetical protein n=1 Tax=Paenibacillus tyrfis TaxID=1501230 RepID=UPI002165E33C|nr:hypothetical protein [Paenibacillus tyrfis]
MIVDAHAFQIDVLALMHAIVHKQSNPEMVMGGAHFGYQRVFDIRKLELPFRIGQPSKCAVHPKADAALIAADMVELPDVRIIQIAHVRITVQVDQKLAVSDD